MNANSSLSDLPLHAFRYAAGELGAAEAVEFEQLLAANSDAQLALVHAVQLAAALQSGSAAPTRGPVVRFTTHVQPTRRWSPVLALLGSAAVAAIVLVALRDESPHTGNTLAGHSGADATVSLWNQLHADDVESASLDETAFLALEDEQTGSDVIPDWLLAAVEIGDALPASEAGDPQSVDETDPIDDES